MWPILQTASAAVAAWYLALALLPPHSRCSRRSRPWCRSAPTSGQRGRRVLELVGGVILGILVSDLIVGAIGTGPWQAGVMIVLAMTHRGRDGRHRAARRRVRRLGDADRHVAGRGVGLPARTFLEALSAAASRWWSRGCCSRRTRRCTSAAR